MGSPRDDALKGFEQDAEALVVYQTDVIAQIESQLRAARETIRMVQRLRGVPHRNGPELTDNQREDTLESLAKEWRELDRQLDTQHECCLEIQNTIAKMRKRLGEMRTLAGRVRPSARRDTPPA